MAESSGVQETGAARSNFRRVRSYTCRRGTLNHTAPSAPPPSDSRRGESGGPPYNGAGFFPVKMSGPRRSYYTIAQSNSPYSPKEEGK
jgi:hypothetical protein